MSEPKLAKPRPPAWLEAIMFLAIMAVVGAVMSLFYFTMTVGSGAALGVITGVLFMVMEFVWRKLMEHLGEQFFSKKKKT